MHVVKGWGVGRDYQVQPPLNKAITCPTMVQAHQCAAALLHYPVNALVLWIQAATPQETGQSSQQPPESLPEDIFHIEEPQAEFLVISKTLSPLKENWNSLFAIDRNLQNTKNRQEHF